MRTLFSIPCGIFAETAESGISELAKSRSHASRFSAVKVTRGGSLNPCDAMEILLITSFLTAYAFVKFVDSSWRISLPTDSEENNVSWIKLRAEKYS
ncbi:hypothetical protein OXX79_013890, partial [Metschnikowia pulcherrima]